MNIIRGFMHGLCTKSLIRTVGAVYDRALFVDPVIEGVWIGSPAKCQMSNVQCRMSNGLVKQPNDPTTRLRNRFASWPLGHLVV